MGEVYNAIILPMLLEMFNQVPELDKFVQKLS